MSNLQPVLLSPGEVTDRAKRAARLEQLTLQGFFGGWLSEAWATRVLVKSGRDFRESWLLHLSESDDEGIAHEPGAATHVVSRTKFPTPSLHGPVFIQERVIETGGEAPVAWVERATASAVRENRRDDQPIRSAIPDATFWELIEILNGHLEENVVEQLVQLLRGWDYSAQVSYQEAFDRKLFELDRPENTVSYLDDPTVVDGEASLVYRCEIIAGGRDLFTQRVNNPQPGVPGVDGTSSPAILYVLEDASPYGLPRKTLPIETGSNPAYWPSASPVNAPWTPPAPERPSPSPFSQRVQLESLGLDVTSSGVLYGFIAYTTTDTYVREIVGCAMAFGESALASELGPLIQARHANEELYGSLIISAQGTGPVRGAPLVEAHRRGPRSIAEYLKQFVAVGKT